MRAHVNQLNTRMKFKRRARRVQRRVARRSNFSEQVVIFLTHGWQC